MATQQPERVEAMVLIGATSYHPVGGRERQRGWTTEILDEEGWARMRRRHHYGDEQIEMLYSQFRGIADVYDDMNFTKPFLSTITARTLVVHGDRDIFFPVAIATEIHEAIPRSYLWIVPNGTHIPIFGDTLPYFVKTAREFLRSDWEEE